MTEEEDAKQILIDLGVRSNSVDKLNEIELDYLSWKKCVNLIKSLHSCNLKKYGKCDITCAFKEVKELFHTVGRETFEDFCDHNEITLEYGLEKAYKLYFMIYDNLNSKGEIELYKHYCCCFGYYEYLKGDSPYDGDTSDMDTGIESSGDISSEESSGE